MLPPGNQTRAPAEIIDADLLQDALDRALAMLGARPRYAAVELWDGGKWLYPEGV